MPGPTLAGTPTTGSSSSTTSHSVTLPTGATSGETLVIAFVCATEYTTATLAGWTKEVEQPGPSHELSVFTKVSDGTETSVSITTGLSANGVYTAYRVQDGIIGGMASGTSGTNFSPDPGDPGSITTSDDVLQIAFAGWHGSATLISYPSGYSTGQASQTTGSGGSAIGVATAMKTIAGATENPPTFSLNAFSPWTAFTLAFEYSSGSTDIDLDCLSCTTTLHDLFVTLQQIDLDTLSVDPELFDLDVHTAVDLVSLSGEWTLEEIFFEIDPVYLDTLELSVSLEDLDSVLIATNIDPAPLAGQWQLQPLVLDFDIALDTLAVSLRMPCLNAFQPIKGRVTQVDMSQAFWNASHDFPASLTEGDGWALSLIKSGTRKIMHCPGEYTWGMSSSTASHELASEGDYIEFRVIGGKIRIINKVIQ